MKILDFILIAIIASCFILAVYKSVSNARKGKCCGNCSQCGKSCNKMKNEK
ncbi:MAG: FeoB-associated Cys-rich membrane protein [Clostridia bacterium]|nr:FeoB-associated Cys-rich membrane protein [Clostridia bacterium]NLS85817.1 FeoB-associated Cys-rich membrane protein [Oscillospiraceae bacterium]